MNDGVLASLLAGLARSSMNYLFPQLPNLQAQGLGFISIVQRQDTNMPLLPSIYC